MKFKIIILSVISILFIGCKEEKKTEQSADSTLSTEVDDIFKVSFGFIATQDDNFHLYYTEDGTINFTEENSVWFPVKGSAQVQDLTFKLPEGVIPTNLRVDFGYGKIPLQTEIILKRFGMELNGKKFEAMGAEIFKYFYPNEANTLLDIETATIRRLTPDSNTAPSIYPHITLSAEIEKLQ